MSYLIIDFFVITFQFFGLVFGVAGAIWVAENVFNVDVDALLEKILGY